MAKPECVTCLWEKLTGNVVDYSHSNMEWSRLIDVSEASIRRHMKHAKVVKPTLLESDIPANARWEVSSDEFTGDTPASTLQLDIDDVEAFIIGKGLNPAEWDYQWRFSEWEQGSKLHGTRTLHAVKVWGKRKKSEQVGFDFDVALEQIAGYEWKESNNKRVEESFCGSQVALANDFQLGKVDWNGGSKETLDQVFQSFVNVRNEADNNLAAEIVVIDGGDIIENFYNTPSQRQTNDLSLPKQVLLAYKVMIKGLQYLTDAGYKVTYVAVPSNHSRDRLGMQAASGDVHDDWGIIIAKLIEASTDIDVIVPEDYFDSVGFTTSNTGIGVVHGHQAGSPDKIGSWWQGQSHGEMPVAHADILVTGHFHSMRVQQSGNKKWIIVGSASDRGSSWFTNNRGERSISGITTFVVRDGAWSDLRIV
jgi:predicted phosphodiesterase